MTRTTAECNLTNIDRAELANKSNANLTVRIHANGSTDTSVYGIELWIPTTKYSGAQLVAESKKAGEFVLSEVIAATGAKNRGFVPTSELTGFNWSKVPVILIEMGYMTNADEDYKLSTSDYQDKLASGMANGILKYFGK